MHYIREATINDAETIRQLAEEIWWPTYSPILADEQIIYMLNDRYSVEELTKQIQENIQTYLLLIADEQAVAFAAYSPVEDDADVYRLHKLYCLPSTHGKGYGKMLLNWVCEKVREAGKHVLELNVHRENNAKSFYEKMGFTITHAVDIPFGPYFLNDYIMRKEL